MKHIFKKLCWIIFCVSFSFVACKKQDPNPNEIGKVNHTKHFDSKVATDWFTLLTHLTRTTPYGPPQSARIFAYTGLTLYESVVPGMPSYQSLFKYFTGNGIAVDKKKNYYWPACANAAIARIASRLLGNYPAIPDVNSIQQLESSINNGFQSLVSQELLQLSNEFGKSVADKIYDWSTTDGTLNPNGTLATCPPYVPLGGPGNWEPTPPGNLPAAGACQGLLRTFMPGTAKNTLPGPHPAYSTSPSSEFYQKANEIYQISLTLTQDDINISQHWRDILGTNYNTPSHVLRLTSQIMTREKLNLEDASVTYARQCIAVFDAIASVFNAKFHYSLLRPVTYIRNTIGVTNWNSLYPTPQHPAYPATAPCAAAAAVEVLEKTFGKNYYFIDSTQHALYGSWTYSSFDAMLQDVKRSRTHSGLNFQFAVDEGVKLGRQVGQMINNASFKK